MRRLVPAHRPVLTQELGPAHHVLRLPPHIRKVAYTTHAIDMSQSKRYKLFYQALHNISPNCLYKNSETAGANFVVCYRSFMVGRLLESSTLLWTTEIPYDESKLQDLPDGLETMTRPQATAEQEAQ